MRHTNPVIPPQDAKFANYHGYSDVEPFEVVECVSPKELRVRKMRAERAPDWHPEFVPGGFSAICTNQSDQRWTITPCPTERTFSLRLHKDGTWRTPNGKVFVLAEQPRKFYDYNF